MEQIAPKRRHINFRGQGITQKTEYNKFVIFVQQICHSNIKLILLNIKQFPCLYYISQCFSVFLFKRLYLGNHIELNTRSYELYFSHIVLYYHLSKYRSYLMNHLFYVVYSEFFLL